MNTQTVQSNWSDIKAKIAARWGKFNDTQLESFRDNLDKIASQVQETYGIAKEQSEKEYHDFSDSLRAMKDTAKANVTPIIQAVKPEPAKKAN